ncbi:MAG: YihA family ribosome biogenesis GTP-binding protein [Flavobacteriales bacterium]|nr:YihA family ribosome biogenesis GTP-binding protein [Flavobacteriales bacterium]
MSVVIKDVSFVMSNSDVRKCPKPDRPEYAFIGRSNVGKSSLINMLMQRKNLAKTSSTPGKTQLINHFLVDDVWYLVDLPGYGFAKVPKAHRQKFEKMISDYILQRENLVNVFVLVDSRHSPQTIDLEFMEWLGMSQIPFSIVFTKLDKLKPKEVEAKIKAYQDKMLETWDELPHQFLTSAEKFDGREELLEYVNQLNSDFAGKFGQ